MNCTKFPDGRMKKGMYVPTYNISYLDLVIRIFEHSNVKNGGVAVRQPKQKVLIANETKLYQNMMDRVAKYSKPGFRFLMVNLPKTHFLPDSGYYPKPSLQFGYICTGFVLDGK